MLAQKQEDGSVRPLAFASWTLQPCERNYGVTELESLGVVWAAKHFRNYLYGHHCDVFTDHEALKSLLNTPQPSGKLARWGMALQELDLSIKYRSGGKNANADALSRAPVAWMRESPQPFGVIAALNTEEVAAKDGEDTTEKRQFSDPVLRRMIDYLMTGTLPTDDQQAREVTLTSSQYTMVDDILYHLEPDKTLRIVPPTTDHQKLFNEAHSGVFGAHLREVKIHSVLSRHYWWPGMRADIVKWSRGCVTCATQSVGRQVKPPLVPIPVAGPFDRVGVDIIQFPRSYKGNQYAIVFVDYLTKWPEVYPASDQTALTVAHLLVEGVISRHGLPGELLSDRGAAFLSRLLEELRQLMGFHKVNTTSYHPQTDGLVERFNRTLTSMLAKTVDKSGKDWDDHLPYVLFAYRAAMQASTLESPFFLLYGRDPRLPCEATLSAPLDRQQLDVDDYKSQVASQLAGTWEIARTNIEKAQKRQKAQHDRHSRTPQFRVGDRVFLFMPAAKTGKAYKFARPYRGPYWILHLHPNGADLSLVDKPQDKPI